MTMKDDGIHAALMNRMGELVKEHGLTRAVSIITRIVMDLRRDHPSLSEVCDHIIGDVNSWLRERENAIAS
jgi:hypothetical protein